MKKNNFIKRVAMLTLAVVMVVTSVMIPAPAKAASESEGFVIASYTMVKGEKWSLIVYNVDTKKAKPTYKSSDKSVATVNKKGVITAKKPGSAKITVTWKEGKTTYQQKVKIKVKKSITYAEAIKRINAELNLLYLYTYEIAEENGWLEDDTALENLALCVDILEIANDMTKDPDSYSDDEIQEELDQIDEMIDWLEKNLPVLATPYN